MKQPYLGKYIGIEKDYKYELVLHPDSSFNLQLYYHDGNPSCIGKWTIKDDMILLNCDSTETLSEQLSNGYLNERTHHIYLKGRRTLEFKGTNLRYRKND